MTTEQAMTVEVVDNHIYFYSRIDTDRCLALSKLLRETDSRLRSEHINRGMENGVNTIPIWLHINSIGGDTISAFAVADQIKPLSSPVYSIIEGMGASAATIIAGSCSKRYITRNSFMLIHQVSSIMGWVTYDEMKDDMVMLDNLMTRLVSFYAEHSKLKKREIRKRLKRDWWMDADQALEDGFVDRIL